MYSVVPVFKPNGGIVLNSPEEFLANNVSPYSRNMEYFNDYEQTRLGLIKFDNAVLSGPVLHQRVFRLSNQTIFYLFFTTRDIYSYDFAAMRFDILTPLYQTGTISISGTAVTGVGTAWEANVKAGDFIKAGTTNINTGATWYEVAAVIDDTHLTLTGVGTTVSGSAYAVRQTFSGDATNYWFSAPFVDQQLGDVLIATNGEDPMIYWNGSGQVKFIPAGNVNYTFTVTSANATAGAVYSNNGQNFTVVETISSSTVLMANGIGFADVSGTLTKVSGTGDSTITFTSATFITGLPTGFIARYVTVYKDRVVLGWCIEGGLNNTRRVRWNDVANIFSWQGIDFEDLLDEDTEITGLCVFDEYLMVGKEKEWYVGRPDTSTFVFDFDKSSTAEGLTSQGSVVVRKDYIYFYGHDKKFHRWNILRDDILSEGIFPETKNFDPNLERFIQGCDFYNKNQIRWMCPYTSTDFNNYIVVYDYHVNSIRVWDCAQDQALACMGFYILQQDLYMDDVVWGEFYLDVTDGYFDEVVYLANTPVFIYGGYDGIVRICDQGPTDDGEVYTRTFRANRNNFQMPDQFKRLWQQQFWFLQDPSTVVTIKMKKDDNASYESRQPTLALQNSNRDVVKLLVKWDKEAQDFQIEISATSFFALMGWLSYVMPKRKIKN